MSHLDDLKVRINGLNEAERVEYNRRLQLLKSTKEAANACLLVLEVASRSLKIISQFALAACIALAALVAGIFVFPLMDGSPNPALIVLACLCALALVLINQQRGHRLAETHRLQSQLTMLERDWAATGLEAGFMFAIIEMEKTLAANTSSYQSLQNVNSAQAAKKKTLSDYEYTLRNEIILNIQNEKDWWSKISVISGKWFEVNG
jgi:hypothetical protein